MAASTVLHEDVVTLADLAVTPLFADITQCLWAEVIQHPTNVNDVLISTGGTPLVPREVDLKFVSLDWLHDLSDINVQAQTAGDKLIVRYETLT